MLIDFREGRIINVSDTNWLPPICALTWDPTHNLSMCPDGELKQPFGVRELQQTEPLGQVLIKLWLC